jgi:predicted RNase H-like HicB family nuclease
MAEKTYAAMFEPTEGGFGISFPDLPGCVSFGTDLDDGVRQAREALSLHLEGMAEDGESLPDQSDYREMVNNPENPPHVVWALITVEAPDAADRVNVYLPRSLLERVDRYVAEHAPMNRSTFFGEAARAHLSGASIAGVAERPAAFHRDSAKVAPRPRAKDAPTSGKRAG